MRIAAKLLDLFPVVVIATCAWLAARTVNAFADVALLSAPPKLAGPRRAPRAAPARSKEIDELVARNLFCSDCAPAAPGSAVAAAAPSDGRPPLSDLPLALVATATTGDPSRSAATVVARDDGRAGLYGVGDVLPGGAVLRVIRASGIELLNPTANRVERLELLAAAPAATPATAAAPPRPAAAPRGPESEFISAVEKGVRKVNDRKYEVDRALVDRILGDPSQLMRTASVMPAVRDGKAAGFRLRGVRGGSIYAALGLQNGDTIRAVNGLEITGPDSALAAYAKLRDGGTFALSVERGGQPMQVEYAIR